MKIFSTKLICLFCFLLALNVNGQSLTVNQLREDFDTLRYALEEAHGGLYRFSSKSVIDNRFSQYRKELNQPMSQWKFYGFLSKFLETLGDGHMKLEYDETAINEIRRRKLRSLLSFESLKEEGVEIEDKNTGELLNENKEIIQKAIQKLSAKYRSVLVLRLIDDYSTEETAKILNLPPGTVLSRLARAQIKLKEYLKPFVSEL